MSCEPSADIEMRLSEAMPVAKEMASRRSSSLAESTRMDR